MPRVDIDLFGEIAVSEAEIGLWLAVVAHLAPESWRAAWYVRAYNVAEKIRAAKQAGAWPPSDGA
jgi:hypothetical protein